MPPAFTTPAELLDEVADDHPDDVMERAYDLSDADESWRRGALPKGVAAAALYAAYLERRPRERAGDGRPTQDAIARELDTNAVTLRERFEALPEGGR